MPMRAPFRCYFAYFTFSRYVTRYSAMRHIVGVFDDYAVTLFLLRLLIFDTSLAMLVTRQRCYAPCLLLRYLRFRAMPHDDTPYATILISPLFCHLPLLSLFCFRMTLDYALLRCLLTSAICCYTLFRHDAAHMICARSADLLKAR